MQKKAILLIGKPFNMMINTIDLVIFLAYFVVAITLGILVSKRAVKNMNSYFLVGNKLPCECLVYLMTPACMILPILCGSSMLCLCTD
jgi:hypothetical protein